jgi:predicted alpha/beta-hydrolase family hydrolase
MGKKQNKKTKGRIGRRRSHEHKHPSKTQAHVSDSFLAKMRRIAVRKQRTSLVMNHHSYTGEKLSAAAASETHQQLVGWQWPHPPAIRRQPIAMISQPAGRY